MMLQIHRRKQIARPQLRRRDNYKKTRNSRRSKTAVSLHDSIVTQNKVFVKDAAAVLFYIFTQTRRLAQLVFLSFNTCNNT